MPKHRFMPDLPAAMLALLMMPALTASAQAPHEEHRVEPVSAICVCRAQGRYFNTGEWACLRTPSGPRRAQCDIDQNVSNWRFTSEVCPES